MNDFLELLPVPRERDLPSGRLEQRKAVLLLLVEADLRSAERRRARSGRLGALRAWLMSLGIIVALIAIVSSIQLTTNLRPQSPRLVEAAVMLGTAPVVASLVAMPRPRFEGSVREGRALYRAIGSDRVTARILLPAIPAS